ncbi:MAG: hypothetical protein PHR87_04850 [Sulfurospirillaceae bacterium]|nr:hypothetical protein [Sulfurospirillaceae bacterium]
MQAFGHFTCKKKLVYRTETYLYINSKAETLSLEMFETLLADKNSIAGTIMLFHPGNSAPKICETTTSLLEQNFDFTIPFSELHLDKSLLAFDGILKAYEGKLIEIKTLFNYNESNLQRKNALVKFDTDLQGSKVNYDADNYNFSKKIVFKGDFIFFAWGEKFDKVTFPHIYAYASGIYKAATQQCPHIAFIHNPNLTIEESIAALHFGHPVASNELKNKLPKALKKAFKTNPPQCVSW